MEEWKMGNGGKEERKREKGDGAIWRRIQQIGRKSPLD
jgi:hypothetical protein